MSKGSSTPESDYSSHQTRVIQFAIFLRLLNDPRGHAFPVALMWCDLGILAACGSYLAGPGSHAATQFVGLNVSGRLQIPRQRCTLRLHFRYGKETNKSVRATVADEMFNSEDEAIWDTGFGCLECYFSRECTGGALVRKPLLGVAGDFWTPSFYFMFNAGFVGD